MVEFKPDILFFSAGFDAHRDEGMVGGKTKGKGVTGADYKTITTAILRAIGPGVPVVSVLVGVHLLLRARDEGEGARGHRRDEGRVRAVAKPVLLFMCPVHALLSPSRWPLRPSLIAASAYPPSSTETTGT